MNSLLFNSIYNYLLLYLAIVPCIFALNLFFIIFPHTPAKRRYRQARYAIATGLLMVAILSFIHWYFQLRELSSYYSIAITIGVLFPALTLFIMAFTAIISEEEIKSEHMERNFIPVIACIITLWGGGFGNDRVRIVILVTASVVFLVETFTLSLLMRRSLNKQVETQRQPPSVQAFMLWLRLPMYWGVVTGVLGVAVMVVSKKIAILLLFNFAIFFCQIGEEDRVAGLSIGRNQHASNSNFPPIISKSVDGLVVPQPVCAVSTNRDNLISLFQTTGFEIHL